MRPLVSVILPCRNEEGSLARALDSVYSSSYPRERIEILICDGMSTDGSRAIALQYAERDERIRLMDNPSRTTPAALNLAIAAARGDFVLRVDGHSTIDPGYVPAAVSYLEQHREAWAAGGPMRTETGEGGFARAIRFVLSHWFGVGNSAFRTTKRSAGTDAREVDALFNGCWRRQVFDRVGNFDERLVRSQDIDFSQRIRDAGGKLFLLPWIESVYLAPATWAPFARQSWSNGVWAILPGAALGRLPLRPRHFAPLAFVLALAMGALLAPVAPWIGTGLAASYGIATLLLSILAAWQTRNLSLALLAPVAFATLHLGYGAGSVWGAAQVLWARLVPGFRRLPPRYSNPL